MTPMNDIELQNLSSTVFEDNAPYHSNTLSHLVLLESPFAGHNEWEISKNVTYARAAMRACFAMGKYPFASHLLYTQPGILDDNVSSERMLGIRAGLEWGKLAKESVFFMDRGFSNGMQIGLLDAMTVGRRINVYSLDDFKDSHITKQAMIDMSIVAREIHDDLSKLVKHGRLDKG